jgi:hypothetical protein
MVNAPSFPVETQPPHPLVSSGERINLSSYVMINNGNKFSHLLVYDRLYLNFSKGKFFGSLFFKPSKSDVCSLF